jgi:hypothetical protein
MISLRGMPRSMAESTLSLKPLEYVCMTVVLQGRTAYATC